MADRPHSLSFDRVADQYDATRGGEERGEATAAALTRHLPPAGRVLEIGVGTGTVAAAVRRQGADVVGVDLSAEMLRHARERLGTRVAQADAVQLPVRDASVAAAYAVWVLHLVADVDAVLAEAARVLAPGGRLLVVPGRAVPASPSDVTEATRRMWATLQPTGPTDAPGRVSALAASHGLRLAARDEFDSSVRGLSPAQLADRITGRSFSVLWGVDEQTWQRAVEPLLADVRAMPDQERSRETVDRYALLVFEREG